MSYYDRYTVIAAHVSLNCGLAGNGVGIQEPYMYTYLDDSEETKTVVPEKYSDLATLPGIQFKRIDMDMGHTYNSLSRSVSMKKFFKTPALLPGTSAAEQFSGDATSNPAHACRFVFGICNFQEGNNPPAFMCNVRVTYTVVFTEPKTVSKSVLNTG